MNRTDAALLAAILVGAVAGYAAFTAFAVYLVHWALMGSGDGMTMSSPSPSPEYSDVEAAALATGSTVSIAEGTDP